MTSSTRLGLAVAFSLVSLLSATPSQSAEHWVAAWAAAPDQAGPPLDEVSVRQVIRTSIGGNRLRVRLSNLYGDAPVTIGPVRVAQTDVDAASGTHLPRLVTFRGKSSVTLAAGAEVLSDPVAFPVRPLQTLAVTFYLPDGASKTTLHGVGLQTALIAPREVTAAETFPTQRTDDARYFLTDLEVEASDSAWTLVAVGDSLTDGVGATPDTDRRWPDALARRLNADPALQSVSVVNAGIAGNRLLSDASEPFVGASTLSRFDRDALGKPGTRWILLFQGINDLSAASLFSRPDEQVSAEQIIAGMRALISRAHARNVKIAGATLLPYQGVRGKFWSVTGEKERLAVNAWIRTSGAFDTVFDLDAVVRDTVDPARLLPAFDSGDHLHLNDAGYAAIASAIDLRPLGGSQ